MAPSIRCSTKPGPVQGVRIGPITIGAPEHRTPGRYREFPTGSVLTRSLRHLLAQPEPGFTGFPDLLLYPIFDQADSQTGLSHAIPSRLPIDHLWIEVKGPNDRAHPAQQAWHHRFLDWAEKVEIWELRPSLVAPVTIGRSTMDIVEEVKQCITDALPGSNVQVQGASGHFENCCSMERVKASASFNGSEPSTGPSST